jgi:hypothetical protein
MGRQVQKKWGQIRLVKLKPARERWSAPKCQSGILVQTVRTFCDISNDMYIIYIRDVEVDPRQGHSGGFLLLSC